MRNYHLKWYIILKSTEYLRMKNKPHINKKDRERDPLPSPDATPEEIGEFWDTHSLADYWDETYQVEFNVNIKSRIYTNQKII